MDTESTLRFTVFHGKGRFVRHVETVGACFFHFDTIAEKKRWKDRYAFHFLENIAKMKRKNDGVFFRIKTIMETRDKFNVPWTLPSGLITSASTVFPLTSVLTSPK